MPKPPVQPCEILGIGAPLIDYVIPIDEKYLRSLNAIKGSMQPVDYAAFQGIVQQVGSDANVRAGGSCANTLKGLANLGHLCALIGKIGKDSAADIFNKSLANSNVKSLLLSSLNPTGQIACLVTPDGERTFRDFLGASKELSSHDLHVDMFTGIELVHIEGYTLMKEGLTQRAMELAKQAGAKISFDLANFEIVREYKEQIIHLLPMYVDIVFANADEAQVLTFRDPERSCSILKDLCEIAVILMGPKGCWIGSGLDRRHCEAYPQEPLDTTGAGDLFIAGFLHGYLTGKSLEVCAHYGALAGAAAVQVFGAELSEETWSRLRKKF